MKDEFKTRKINQEESLGKNLKKARKKSGLSFKKIEKKTKIKIEYLEMLEENNFKDLPDDVYIRGFLRSLANLYRIDEVELINSYRRNKDSRTPSEKNNVDFRNSRIKKPLVLITPRVISVALVAVVGIALLSYLWLEVSGFAIAPKLTLNQPVGEEIKLEENRLQIQGETDKNSSITINKEPIPVNEEGQFGENIQLQLGYNLIGIEAVNQGGKVSTKIIKIVVENKDGKISKIGK